MIVRRPLSERFLMTLIGCATLLMGLWFFPINVYAQSHMRVTGTSPIAEPVWPLFIAQEKGFFAKEGLEIEITFTRAAVKALIGGSVNLINEGADDGLTLMQKGQNIIAVGAIQLKPGEFLVTLPPIKTLEQLRGKQFAVSGIPATDMRLAAEFLESRGLKKGDVIFRKIGFTSARLAALQAEQVSGTLLSPGGWLKGRKKAKFNTLATPGDFGIFPWNVMQTNRAWARENRKSVVGYIRGVKQAIAWLYDPGNLEEAKRILTPKVQLDDEEVAELLKIAQRDKIYFDQKLTPEVFKRPVDFLIEDGTLKPPVDIDQFLDVTFSEEAAQVR